MMNRRIRISTQLDVKGGSLIRVADADTGELIPEISNIVIRLDRNDLTVADITYGEGFPAVVRRSPVEEISVVISSEEFFSTGENIGDEAN